MPQIINKFRTQRGWLTAYSFACGYLEEKHAGPLTVKMEQPAPGFYRVEWWDNAEGKWQGASDHYLLGLARKAYQRRLREMPEILLARALEL